MSGHSKWATIKRQKGVTDIKRGATFTKLSNAITVAVRQGGGVGDPASNFKLRLAIDAARSANMPKDNIARAIERAVGKQGDNNFEEAVYEGFGPGGITIIVEAATDNKNRTNAEVKNTFDKSGGNMGQPGSVSYLFKQIGQIILKKDSKTFDEIFTLAAEAGAEDVVEESDEFFVYSNPTNLARVRDNLIASGLNPIETEIIRQPLNFVQIPEGEQATKIMKLLDKLEELDDVQKVYSNFELS